PPHSASKSREGGSLRRPLRVGFLTLPAPQERGPRPCAPGMAPRSLSCHAVGLPPTDPPGLPPRTPGPRLGPPEGRGLEAPPAKRGGTPRGSCVRQTPPPKPSRSPQTRLSVGPPPAPPVSEGGSGGGGGDGEEPVYIEMVGDARRGVGGDPRRGVGGGAPPPPPPEEPEAIYEEMSCPLPAGGVPDGGHAPFPPSHAPFPPNHARFPMSHAPFPASHAPFTGPAPIPPPFPNL
ncbi:NYAP1 kinase, partial [Atlantisia rogersi]|nr:NYAP1 kinase [Atlantisia rogersi]